MNKVIEDLNWFYKTLDIGGKTAEFYEAQKSIILQALIELEKQIPMKPINKTKPDNGVAQHYENCHIVVCPSCAGRLKLKSKGNYCDKCGQAIKWE